MKILNEETERYHAGKASAYSIARMYEALGEKEKALDWLEKDYEDRSTWISSLNVDFAWDDIRTEPRFITLLKKVGLAK